MESIRYKEKKQLRNTSILDKALKLGGVPVRWFKRGNGIKTVLSKLGRLNDFSGVYVIKDDKFQRVIAGSSNRVLNDILTLVRGYRKSDKQVFSRIAKDYGYQSNLAGLTFLKEMKVWWIEESDEKNREMLTKMIRSNHSG